MKNFAITIGFLGLVTTLAPTPAGAQTASRRLTSEELAAVARDSGSVLRFRQLGGTDTVARGHVDLGIQFASAPVDTSARSWNAARLVARFGLTDRVDLGAWGGYDPHARDGMAGIDVKIALVRQGSSMPVSVSVRPSFSSLLGASEVWAATAGVDLTVSRAFGALAPYAGVAAASSIAADRLSDIDFERVAAGSTLGYAGLAYTWRSWIAAVEVEKGRRVSYALRLGTRF